MSSDDYWAVAYKTLSYLYSCMRAGKRVDVRAARELAGVNESYFGEVARGFQAKGLVSGFHFDGLSGVIVDTSDFAYQDEPAVTMDGATETLRTRKRWFQKRASPQRNHQAI